jgi:hypothetical protein
MTCRPVWHLTLQRQGKKTTIRDHQTMRVVLLTGVMALTAMENRAVGIEGKRLTYFSSDKA